MLLPMVTAYPLSVFPAWFSLRPEIADPVDAALKR